MKDNFDTIHQARFLLATSLLSIAGLFVGCHTKTTSESEAATNVEKQNKKQNDFPNETPLRTQNKVDGNASHPSTKLRVATFNVSLFREQAGQLSDELRGGNEDNAHRLAHIIQTIRPDVLLLNEFDYDHNNESIRCFANEYLNVGHDTALPIDYPHFYTNEVNTGVPSGLDLDRDGETNGWNDCFGFGRHPGQYGMVVFSKFPIDNNATRTFQKLLWKDMPGAQLPTDPETNENYYSDEVLNAFRLSSKSHWDVVINVNEQLLHFVVSHPTPPVFDGAEDRNGKRNHDEIRLIADFVSNDPGNYIVDDQGRRGGLEPNSHFIIAGDLNADPNDGASSNHSIRQLTEHPLIQTTPTPSSEGAVEAASQREVNLSHQSDPSFDTADFGRNGCLRVDYVLPSKTLKVTDAGVYWPRQKQVGHELLSASDHRLVWIDIEIGNDGPSK